jgi:WD40 repeat protein
MASLRDAITGLEISRVPCPSRCRSAAFSPDGRSIVLAAASYVKLWDVASGREVRTLEDGPDKWCPGIAGHRPLAFSPDGQFLAAGSGVNHGIHLWKVATGQELGPLQGHHGHILSLAFASDSRTLISGSQDTTALIWDVSSFVKHGNQ